MNLTVSTSMRNVVDRKSARRSMVKKAEPYEGYWEKSYEFVFNKMETYFGGDDFTRALEFGVGNGEFFQYYADHFDTVVAVEKNWKSRDRAMEDAYWNDRKHIQFKDSTEATDDLKSSSFDAVLICQSFRHMTSKQSRDIIEKSRELLRDEGVLLILAPYRKDGQDPFLRTYLDDQKGYLTETVSKKKFESIEREDESQLKLRRYKLEYFNQLDNLNVDKKIYFHDLILPNFIDKYLSRDSIINNFLFRGRFGSEIAVALKKT